MSSFQETSKLVGGDERHIFRSPPVNNDNFPVVGDGIAQMGKLGTCLRVGCLNSP